jgi:hypothetical protein
MSVSIELFAIDTGPAGFELPRPDCSETTIPDIVTLPPC